MSDLVHNRQPRACRLRTWLSAMLVATCCLSPQWMLSVWAKPLTGLVMDQTYSASGQRFYYALSQVWRDNPYASRYNLYVRETTRTRNGNRIVVFLDEREVQQVMLGSRLKDMTPLVASVEQRLNQLAMIRQSATPDMAANGY